MLDKFGTHVKNGIIYSGGGGGSTPTPEPEPSYPWVGKNLKVTYGPSVAGYISNAKARAHFTLPMDLRGVTSATVNNLYITVRQGNTVLTEQDLITPSKIVSVTPNDIGLKFDVKPYWQTQPTANDVSCTVTLYSIDVDFA